MRRTMNKTKRLGVRERKIERLDPMKELRDLKEQELRSVNGGLEATRGKIISGRC